MNQRKIFNCLRAGAKSRFGYYPNTLNIKIGIRSFFPLKSNGYFLNITKNIKTPRLQMSTFEV